MGFQLSPGVEVREFDLTSSVPTVSTTLAAIAGVFTWGPVEDPTLVSVPEDLASKFGTPTDDNFETYFCAENFLAYGNRLLVSRAIARTYNTDGTLYSTAVNASSKTGAAKLIKNSQHFATLSFTSSDAEFYAKYPGTKGNALRVAVCSSPDQYQKTVGGAGTTFVLPRNSNVMLVSAASEGARDALAAEFAVGNLVRIVSGSVEKLLKVRSISTSGGSLTTLQFSITFTSNNTLGTEFSSSTVTRFWEFADVIRVAPSNVAASNTAIVDGLHVVVVDTDGSFVGRQNAGSVVQSFTNLSRVTTARSRAGSSLFFRDVINNNSPYIWVGDVSWAGAASATAVTNLTLADADFPLAQGSDDAAAGPGTGGDDAPLVEGTETGINLGSMYTAYDVFNNTTDFDISLIIAGKSVNREFDLGETLPNYIIDNIAEVRKDVVAFVSPSAEASLGQESNQDAVEDEIAFRNALRPSSYAFLVNNYKYQYDRYNDVYRWVPLCGDVAGLAVATDASRDPWYSFAGFNRGQIKNIIRLAYNPNKAQRDALYQKQINPVVSFPGEGYVLYGDRTLLPDASAFQYANVRRLFIVLEKAIARYAKRNLFEFNNVATRAAFVNRVEPFLRDVQARNGIYEFRVVCDSSNNTGEIVDRGEFRGDIYIKPARSINFIQLNFVAVKTDVEFAEIIGTF
jgi:hypothetical protein